MKIMEAQYEAGRINKTTCDFCNEEPENGVLIEKPHSMIINGQLVESHRPKPIHICLDCLVMEIENL